MTGAKKPCPECQYEVVEDDLYCSYCGRRLFEFLVEPTRLIYYVDPDCPGAMRRQLKIGDGGWGHPVLECDVLPEWLHFDSGALTLTVDADQLPFFDLPPEVVTIRARGTDVERDIEISVASLPVPDVRPLTLARGYTSGTPAQMELEIFSPATLESLVFRPGYLELDARLPIELSIGKNSIPLKAQIPPGQEGNVRSVAYTMTLRGITNALTGSVELTLQDPPSLSVVEIDQGHPPQVLNEAEGEFVLTCENTGKGATLLVEDLVLSPRPGSAAPAISFSRTPFRASIEKGKSVEFVFQARPTGPVATGRYSFDVTVRSNDPSSASNRRTLAVRVTDEEFLQCVAIDYGTIDSTIAVFDNRTGGPKNLLLERRQDKDPKIYSNVFFSDYLPGETPPFEWEIGGRASALGSSNRGQLVTAVKVRVGSGHKEEIEFTAKGIYREVESEQVVTLALRSLLVRAKHELRQRPAQFALCVPTRFTLRRKEILRKALLEAARQLSMEISVRLVDESLAAGVFSFLAGTAGAGKAEFTMMVVDFGGGTTDVTVFRVKRDPSTGNLLAAEIVGAWGDPELGGEVITQDLAALLLSEFSGRADSSPEGIRKMSVEAERLKVAISELEEARRQTGGSQVSAVIEKLGVRASERIGYVCRVMKITSEELRGYIQEYLSSGVLSVQSQWYGANTIVKIPGEKVVKAYENRLERLRTGLPVLLRRIGLPKVDQVLLAGQSSRFPTVRDYLQEFGEEISFITDGKGEVLLKECVSQGALMLVGEEIKVEGEDRLWTRLGYVTGVRFHELIGWGARYPVSSAEIELKVHQVSQGWLQLEILENMNLEGIGPLAKFGKFKIQVGTAEGPFYFKLYLDEKATPHGLCRYGSESQASEMDFEPQPAANV
jgi:molecular chaperone DnaK (HSP70)